MVRINTSTPYRPVLSSSTTSYLSQSPSSALFRLYITPSNSLFSLSLSPSLSLCLSPPHSLFSPFPNYKQYPFVRWQIQVRPFYPSYTTSAEKPFILRGRSLCRRRIRRRRRCCWPMNVYSLRRRKKTVLYRFVLRKTSANIHRATPSVVFLSNSSRWQNKHYTRACTRCSLNCNATKIIVHSVRQVNNNRNIRVHFSTIT